MKLNVFPTARGAAGAAAEVFAEQLRNKPVSNFGMGAGATFIPFYEELVKMYEVRGAPFSKFRSFQVNEFMGMPGTHPMSNRYFLVDAFYDHIPAPRRFQKRLPGLPVNIEATCRQFEARIKRMGGLDLLVLGIGVGDWLGFNEKGSSFDSLTRMCYLSDELREYYSKEFPRGSVPRRGITMGIKTMLDAKRIIVLVTGEHKAPVLGRMFKSTISASIPSTALKKHGDVEVFADEDAAAEVRSFDKGSAKKTGKKDQDKNARA